MINIEEVANKELKNIIEIVDQINTTNKTKYPMCGSQLAQLNCVVTTCKFYKGGGTCSNVSPAITLNLDGTFVCWSRKDGGDIEYDGG
jgi:hypothetical protein